uniref:Ig-like domain-containing protein n=1 Tax=Tetraodon nigroviridis TaxID=99883 RepID=H3BXM2_TETNG
MSADSSDQDFTNENNLLLWECLQAQAGWSVTYTYRHICAVRGSTVSISCTYTYPPGLRVTSTFWVRKDNLKSEPEYSGRVESVCDNNNECTLIIRDLTESDSGVYKFRITTNIETEKWTGEPGVSLTVTADQSRNQTELTCVSQCGDSLRSSYIWYRNDETVGGQTQRKLVLQSTDATGRYSCALSGHQRFRSPPVYAPEGPSVSVSPSAEVEEGSSVTLSCSCDANPAANYSWFKDGEETPKSSEQNFTITNVRAEDAGTYSCRVWNLLGHSQSTVEVTVVTGTFASIVMATC